MAEPISELRYRPEPKAGVRKAAELRDAVVVNYRARLPAPLFVFALPRSFTSLVGAMLGQHPQMFGLPETHLLCERTVGAWLKRSARSPWPMSHGLVRAVAQLHFGAQDERAAQWAVDWVRARAGLNTEQLFKLLVDRVHPLRVVDKSPSTIDSVETMERARDWFPNAHFLHLVRHPRGYGESIMKLVQRKSRRSEIPPAHWLVQIATDPSSNRQRAGADGMVVLDPQHGWYERNVMIRDFMATVPSEQRMVLRGEDVLLTPDAVLPTIADWLGIRTDERAIDEMKHPERSPFAFLGPARARYGNDGIFLEDPALRPSRGQVGGLTGSVSWRANGKGFLPQVKGLAEEFGYK
jgi:Sulfotransferase family